MRGKTVHYFKYFMSSLRTANICFRVVGYNSIAFLHGMICLIEASQCVKNTKLSLSLTG